MAIPAASAKAGCCCLGLLAGATVAGFPYVVVLSRLRVCHCSCFKGCALILVNFDKLSGFTADYSLAYRAEGYRGKTKKFVLRSSIRTGFKREFEFAIKAQSKICWSLGRTRASKHGNVVQVVNRPVKKQSKKSSSAKVNKSESKNQQLL
ncbi:hypothetical protein PIB30_049360 [Stylosanthes scabra]|uniref:Secreted protein n=1 Tax=Stylosanthes scabra TaxID=79078 RepID=A0ABU6SIU8_9FABA|nr:hypothetical protein [Stylosanthes scabra]